MRILSLMNYLKAGGSRGGQQSILLSAKVVGRDRSQQEHVKAEESWLRQMDIPTITMELLLSLITEKMVR